MAQKLRQTTEAAPARCSAAAAARRLDPVLIVLAAAATLYILATTLVVIRNCRFPLPYGDEWDHWRKFFALKNYTSFLFDQHNEHRIALARMFFYIDQFVFHARGTFLLVSIAITQAITGWCLWRLAISSGTFSRNSRILLGCFIAACLFSAQQYQNFTWGFQIQFVAVYCTAVGALFAVARAAEALSEARRWQWIAGACLLAILCTYSMSNGLLIWPILLFMWLCLRQPLRYGVPFAVGMVLLGVAYLWGYHSPTYHANPIDSLTHHLIQVLAFASSAAGSPADAPASTLLRILKNTSDLARVEACAIFGFLGVLAALACGIALWRRRGRINPRQVALFCVLLFVMVTAFLVGLGRVNFPLTDSLVSRYATPAMVFWTALTGLVLSLLDTRYLESDSRTRFAVYGALVFLMIAGVAAEQRQWIEYSRVYRSGISEVEAAMVTGVYDRDVWLRAYHTPTSIFEILDYMRNNRLAVFTEDWTHWTGTPLSPHFTVDNNKSCLGSFDSATAVPSAIEPGSKVAGWAWDRKDGRAPEAVILADRSGRIVGVVHNLTDRQDVAAAVPETRSANVGWRGYILPTDADPVTAYLLESDGKSVCAVGALPSGKRIEEASFADVLAPVPTSPGTSVSVEGAWTKDGYHHDAGRPPFEGPVYGSWSGSDANTGTVHLGTFRVSHQTAIAIPLVSGPKTGGLLVKVINAKTGETIAMLAPPPARAQWWAWRIDLPAADPDLTIHLDAQDMGRDWGEWLGIGTPHLLRNSTLTPLATVNQTAREVPFAALGAALETGNPLVAGSWTRDGYFPNVGSPPVEGPVFGSWTGADSHTGSIQMGPFLLHGRKSIALPMITGPSSTGMVIRIVDAVNGGIIAWLSPPPVHVKWWAWKIDLPESSGDQKILVVAEDNGASWGQWQAVGVPHLLK